MFNYTAVIAHNEHEHTSRVHLAPTSTSQKGRNNSDEYVSVVVHLRPPFDGRSSILPCHIQHHTAVHLTRMAYTLHPREAILVCTTLLLYCCMQRVQDQYIRHCNYCCSDGIIKCRCHDLTRRTKRVANATGIYCCS